jgi:Tol biopolymer transport system component
VNRSKIAILACALAVLAVTAWPAVAQAHVVERVSVATGGTQGENGSQSYLPSMSADGRFVAFVSSTGNLVAGDTNGADDVFVRDRQTGTTERVSIATDGTQANDHCGVGGVAISGDGRYVVFRSDASNLVTGPTDGYGQILIRDRVSGTTEEVSVAMDGTDGSSGCNAAAISADGRYVAFMSYSTDLVPADTNGKMDIFVRDRVAATTVRLSVDGAGAQGNDNSWDCSISADGRYVAFQSSFAIWWRRPPNG